MPGPFERGECRAEAKRSLAVSIAPLRHARAILQPLAVCAGIRASGPSFNRTFATCPGHSTLPDPRPRGHRAAQRFNRTFATCPGHSATQRKDEENEKRFNRTFATCPGHSILLSTTWTSQGTKSVSIAPLRHARAIQEASKQMKMDRRKLFQSHLCDMPGPFIFPNKGLWFSVICLFQSHLCDMPGPFRINF